MSLPLRYRRTKSMVLQTGFAGGLLLLSPRTSRADDFFSYKYADYRESGGRIAVQTQSALIEQDLGPDMQVKLQGVIDAIAGATPTGQPAPAGSDQVPLETLQNRRKAWNADFSRQFPHFNLDLGFANSRENHYASTGWSVNTLTDFNQKNTTLLAGVAGTDDDVKVLYQLPWVKKRTNDVIAGITQLIDPLTSVSFNVSWGRATGDLNDSYKEVQKTIEVIPGNFLPLVFLENRPDHRTKLITRASLNRAFPAVHGTLEAGWRFYHDTFGTDAHTIELTWLQRIGKGLILEPELRFYDQTAANFYYYQLDQTTIVPPFGLPSRDGPFYSSDYRLSALRTYAYGMKAVWSVSTALQFDLDVDRYDMRGKDGVTPASAYPHASIVTAGIRITW